ncbi:nucleotidyl transferase AbiEii/AbiGii toxin family protein [Candidatus Woesearchaeota archaeon]|nr:nucleotidyl transferase AbiEii/AbiGii toxin family protein [Candidatus Woesearchaeota archaeon]
MIDIRLIDYLSGKSGIRDKSLIEKDFILQSLLVGFAKDKYFSGNFVFKGGTCLVKCYLGYFRFSEDLDFTYINQGAFKGKSENGIRRFLSSEISRLLGIVGDISKAYGLDFKAGKENKRYAEFGGSNRFLTLKIWYVSAVSRRDQFIKIQLNYVDLFKYRFKKLAAKPMIEADAKEAEFLFPGYAGILLAKPKLMAYDIREILLEKVRAILTRRGTKARDFVDVFVITEKLDKDMWAFKKDVILKAKFMLKYEKYRQNLKEKIKVKRWVKPGEEEHLLLKPLKGFQPFLEEFYPFLDEVVGEVLRE